MTDLSVAAFQPLQQLLDYLNSIHMTQPATDRCAICSQHPEDMLILSCSHNLCLACSTQLYTASSHANFLQCEICLASTPLDAETVRCLTDLSKPPTTVWQNSPKIPKPGKTSKKNECMDHHQESLYFCLDCQNCSICSECVLEETHAGHSLMTLKKASKIFSLKLEEHSRQLQYLKLKTVQNSEAIKEKRETILADFRQKQASLAALFESIIKAATDRYNNLTSDLQAFSRRSTQMMEGRLQFLSQRIITIDQQINDNRETAKKCQQLDIIQRYLQMEEIKNQMQQEVQTDQSMFNGQIGLENEGNCVQHFYSLLNKIVWTQNNELYQPSLKQNQLRLINSNEHCQSSLLGQRALQFQNHSQLDLSHEGKKQKKGQNVVINCSRIKDSSRRLELSRSMNNATNIISRLQQRARK